MMSVSSGALPRWSDAMLVSSAELHNSLRFSWSPCTARATPTHRKFNHNTEQERK